MAGSIIITQNMFNNLEYDQMDTNSKSSVLYTTDKTSTPTALIVFAKSDINSALYHLAESMNNPFKTDAITTILVEESIKDDFLEKLQKRLKPLNSSIKMLFELFKSPIEFKTKHIETDGIIRLICNMTHSHFIEGSGIVTFHNFRTIKECINLIQKESLSFTNATIWHENHGFAYELVIALKVKNNYINCYNVDITAPLLSQWSPFKTYAIIHNNYHYEKLLLDDVEKYIVFPIGSIFAN